MLNAIKRFTKNLRRAVRHLWHRKKAFPSGEVVSYKDAIRAFESGDIIAVRTGNGVGVLDKIFGYTVSLLTGYDTYHVGTILIIGGRRFVLEAIFPRVRLSLLSTRTPFVHIAVPSDGKDEEEKMTQSLQELGRLYSIPDAVRSYWSGRLPDKNGVDCVELTNKLLEIYTGDSFPGTLIPGDYVRNLVHQGYSHRFIEETEDG